MHESCRGLTKIKNDINFAQFGAMILNLCLIEMDRPKIPCFWKTENLLYVVASVDRNQERTKGSVQHEKCPFIYLL